MVFKVIHIVSFLDTQPQYNLNNFLSREKKCQVYVLYLPSYQPVVNGFRYESRFYDKGALSHRIYFTLPVSLNFKAEIILNYILNIYSAIYFLYKSEETFDYGIGETSFGGMILYLLRRLRKVNRSIFMNGDVIINNRIIQSKKRYGVFTDIQFLMKRLAYRNDLVWFVSDKVKDYELSHNLIASNQINLPGVTINIQNIGSLLESKKIFNLAYIGRLEEETGIDLLMESLSLIKNKFNNIKVLIIGGSELKQHYYKQKSEELKIESMFKFVGNIESRSRALDYLSQAMYGFAMYQPLANNSSKYADNGKIKDYVQCGIPILITKGFHDKNDEMNSSNGFIEVNYDKFSLADFIQDNLDLSHSNSEAYEQIQKQIVNFASRFDHIRVFETLWEKINSL